MFTIDSKEKRVVIAHTVQASDGSVYLTTTIDLNNVPDNKLLLWAATNRLTRWLNSTEIGQLTREEVKMRFDNHVLECREYLLSNNKTYTQEEKIIADSLRDVIRKGASVESILQALIRSTLQYGH
jgi:hypothetical protein